LLFALFSSSFGFFVCSYLPFFSFLACIPQDERKKKKGKEEKAICPRAPSSSFLLLLPVSTYHTEF